MADEAAPQRTFRLHRMKRTTPMRPWVEGEDMTGIAVDATTAAEGGPQPGDMVAHNPGNPQDQWLVRADHYRMHFEPVEPEPDPATPAPAPSM